MGGRKEEKKKRRKKKGRGRKKKKGREKKEKDNAKNQAVAMMPERQLTSHVTGQFSRICSPKSGCLQLRESVVHVCISPVFASFKPVLSVSLHFRGNAYFVVGACV